MIILFQPGFYILQICQNMSAYFLQPRSVHIFHKYVSSSVFTYISHIYPIVFPFFSHMLFPFVSHRFPIKFVHIFHACSPYISHIFVHIFPIELHVPIYLSLIFMLTEFLPSSKTHRFWWGGVGWGGMLTFICTSTSTWCYASARSSATSTQTWCYATACSSATSKQTWCYATACSSATSTHTAYIKQLSWFDFGPLEEKKRWEACRWKR